LHIKKENVMNKVVFFAGIILYIVVLTLSTYASENLSQMTKKGKYRLDVTIGDGELKPGMNTLDITVRDDQNRVVEGADIQIAPWMPAMGHGIDIKPTIIEKGGGRYTLENIYISMVGHWELRIDVEKDGVRDRVVFDFPQVGKEGASGMYYMEHMEHHMTGQAPIGVMGGHTHHEGGWMLSYRYMFMNMHGNRDDNDRLDTSDVLDDFMVSPTDMTMQMHMLGIMYAPTVDLTLITMFPYVHKEMDHVTRLGTSFTTSTEGLGDIKASALYNVYRNEPHSVHLTAGLSIPTGSIDEKGNTPMGRDVQLPYPMQLGSGTFDILPGITYLGRSGSLSWGSQVSASIRVGENDNDYTLGDTYKLTGWLSRSWNDWFSASARVDGQVWGDIEGADPEIARVTPMGMRIIPTADPDLRGGDRIDLLAGIDISSQQGKFKGARLAIEGGIPLYQSLDGPQLETDWFITAGLQWMF
jgi:hypothetical protein